MKRLLLPFLAITLMASTAQAAAPAAACAALSFGDELTLDTPAFEKAADLPILTINGTADVLANQVDLATLYVRAVKAQKEIWIKSLLVAAKAIRAERAAILSDLEKSLVEREAARAEADTAMPEASPAAIPFSTSRPDSLVSADAETSVDSTTLDFDLSCAPQANTPEPSTWALFGVGAALMIFVVPQQTVRPTAVAVKI